MRNRVIRHETYEKLGVRELELIHRSLEAVRTLGLVERQDVLLEDTLNLVEVVLRDALVSEQAPRLRAA
jgi:hypothetical protein